MARPLRIEYPGAWYHVMNRGLGRRVVFKTHEHHEYFLSLLGDTADRFSAEWHAYCLMGNHYHLMLRTPEANLQRIMRHINGLYTQYFNRGVGRDGPLFRGRYRAILVDADAYWLQLSRYIHRNPLDAGLVKRLVDYRWSSYRAYVGRAGTPEWLVTDYILQSIGQRRRRDRYAAFVSDVASNELLAFYGKKQQNPILGDDGFRRRVLVGKAPEIDVPGLRRAQPAPSLDKIVAATCRELHADESDVWRKTRGRGSVSPARGIAMYLCQRAGHMPLSAIADAFGLASYASAGASIRRVRERLAEDKSLRTKVDHVLLELTT